MKNLIYLFSLTLLILLAGCTRDDNGEGSGGNQSDQKLGYIADNMVDKGVLHVKLKPEFVEKMSIVQTRSGQIETGIASIDELVEKLGAVKMERIFPHSGKFEERARKAGLHLWYVVHFDESIPVTRAATDFSNIDEIAYVEGSHKIRQIGNPTFVDADLIGELAAPLTRAGTTPPFNDPRLPNQWNYKNDGSLGGARPGSDINLYRAWEIETGKPEVIVSVHDGGIDHQHEDLAANIWINTAELNGTSSVDDDNNGYVDDVYGWNFAADSPTIIPENHATHVAGTIAAVNNNGIGVSGVAGGDGSPNSGVRIMSCQIMVSGTVPSNASAASSYQYAADNGAVISQNSWGFTDRTMSQLFKEAIDYFIDNAGLDENGNQVGPMAGGVVIFAADNENSETITYPSSYERVCRVSAIGPNFVKGSYAQYGTWMSIFAPGGGADMGEANQILSTIPSGYGYSVGTSMACPHVSGVAALLVSKFGVGTPGLTPDRVLELIDLGARDLEPYNVAALQGKLGAGYIDAYKSLMEGAATTPPNPVTDIEVTWGTRSVEVSWTLPAAAGNTKPWRVELCYSLNNLNNANLLSGGINRDIVYIDTESVGDRMTHTVTGLVGGYTNYLAVCVVDIDNNYSEPVLRSGFVVGNNPPQLTGETIDDVLLTSIGAERTFDLTKYFTDIDEEELTYEITVSTEDFLSYEVNGNALTITSLKEGTAVVGIVASDPEGDSSGELTFNVTCRLEQGQAGDVPLLYPNPVEDTLNIRTAEAMTVEVRLINSRGAEVLTSTLECSDAQPGRLDVTKLSGGVYTVETKYNGGSNRQTIVKK